MSWRLKQLFYFVRGLLLLPITLMLSFCEWYHFSISNWLVGIHRDYRDWLNKDYWPNTQPKEST